MSKYLKYLLDVEQLSLESVKRNLLIYKALLTTQYLNITESCNSKLFRCEPTSKLSNLL